MKRLFQNFFVFLFFSFVAIWTLSFYYMIGIERIAGGGDAFLAINRGSIYCEYDDRFVLLNTNPSIALKINSPEQSLNEATEVDRFRFLGLIFRKMYSPGISAFVIPPWFVLMPVLLTYKLWLRPIRSWWLDSERRGFEVEMEISENSLIRRSNHGLEAHATETSVKSE